MNMKKIVSAASALTIAASAFTSMGIVGHAADDYEIIFGTAVTDESGATTGVTPQTEFATDASTQTLGTYSNYKLEGSVLAGNQANGRTYDFSSPITAGRVYFSTMAKYVGGTYNFWNIVANAADGTTYNLIQAPTAITGTSSSSGNYVETEILRVNGTSIKSDGTSYIPRNQVFYHEIMIDMTAGTITYSTAYASNGSGGNPTAYKTVSNTVDIPDNIISIKGLAIPRCGKSADNYYDSVSLYAAIPQAGSHQYVINAVDENGNFLQGLATGTAAAGETYGIEGLSEVISVDGKYYQLDSTVANHSASYTMGDEDVVKTVKYNSDDTIVAYIEGEDLTPSRTADAAIYEDAAYSGGKAQTITGNRNLYTTINLAESGEYSFVVGQGARKSSGSNPSSYTGDIRIDNIALGSLTGTISGTLVETMPNAMIVAGEHTLSAVVTGNALSPIDYVIIKKADDYVAPASATRQLLYSGTTDTDNKARDNGSAWLVKVKSDTDALTITKLGVSIDGTEGDKTITTSISGNGEAVFAVAVNKTAENIGSFNVLADNTPIETTLAETTIE